MSKHEKNNYFLLVNACYFLIAFHVSLRLPMYIKTFHIVLLFTPAIISLIYGAIGYIHTKDLLQYYNLSLPLCWVAQTGITMLPLFPVILKNYHLLDSNLPAYLLLIFGGLISTIICFKNSSSRNLLNIFSIIILAGLSMPFHIGKTIIEWIQILLWPLTKKKHMHETSQIKFAILGDSSGADVRVYRSPLSLNDYSLIPSGVIVKVTGSWKKWIIISVDDQQYYVNQKHVAFF